GVPGRSRAAGNALAPKGLGIELEDEVERHAGAACGDGEGTTDLDERCGVAGLRVDVKLGRALDEREGLGAHGAKGGEDSRDTKQAAEFRRHRRKLCSRIADFYRPYLRLRSR